MRCDTNKKFSLLASFDSISTFYLPLVWSASKLFAYRSWTSRGRIVWTCTQCYRSRLRVANSGQPLLFVPPLLLEVLRTWRRVPRTLDHWRALWRPHCPWTCQESRKNSCHTTIMVPHCQNPHDWYFPPSAIAAVLQLSSATCSPLAISPCFCLTLL